MNSEQVLFEETSAMIEQSKRTIYSRANSETSLFFWKTGRRGNNEVLNLDISWIYILLNYILYIPSTV